MARKRGGRPRAPRIHLPKFGPRFIHSRCPWCRAEAGMLWPSGTTSTMCARHARAMGQASRRRHRRR